jgi:hypothetical protein
MYVCQGQFHMVSLPRVRKCGRFVLFWPFFLTQGVLFLILVRKRELDALNTLSRSGRRYVTIFLSIFIFEAFCSQVSLIFALDIVPFATKNQSPLVQIYGLPSAGNARLVPPGETEIRMVLDYASNYVEDRNAVESITLDGETARITLHGRYGVSKNMEYGIEIPYVVHGGGFLDSFMIHYHDLFGFPQGGRDQAPRNRVRFHYTRDGVEKIHVERSSNGFGDVSLTAGFQMYDDGKEYPRAAALRMSLKLPTGDSDSLHGSGSTDFSCWMTARDDYKVRYGHAGIFAALGFMAMTGGDVLPEQQRHYVGFGSVGGGWSPLSWLALKIQLDAHTSFYTDSQLRSLSSSSAQLILGGTLAFSEGTSLDIGVSEDIVTKTAPDVVFHFALRTRF